MLIVFLISLIFSNKYINKDLATFLGMVGGWGICWGRNRSISWGRSWSISWGRRMIRGRGWSISRGRSMVAILVVLDKGLVRAWDSLILDISMVLLVFIHKVVNNLSPAVRELHSVLTFHIVSISLLSS